MPSNLSAPSNQIVAGCPAQKGNRFVVAGRGGIPDNPRQYLRRRALWQDTRNLPGVNRSTQPTTNRQPSTPLIQESEHELKAIAHSTPANAIASVSQENNQPLVEAQAWMVDEKGTVIFIAEPYREKAPSFLVFSPSCRNSSN